MPIDLDPDRVLASPFAIGGLGSLVALKFAPGDTWLQRCRNVAAGALCAGYCAPALAEWLHVVSAGMHSFLSFAVGMFGLSLAAAVAEGIRGLHVSEIISGWLSRRG